MAGLKRSVLPVQSEWLRARVSGSPLGVDRDKARINGYVVAQEGPFKTPGRGEFNRQSLDLIVALMKQEDLGLKVRFTHPSLSEDGLGKFLGRSKNPRLSGDRVRADLVFNKIAFNTPSGDLATYTMDLADSDPDALSSSLVLQVEEMEQTDQRGKPLLDDEGDPLPPIWLPTELHASDIVEVGDAVDSLLSAGGLPDDAVRLATQMLDKQFPGDSPEVIYARCQKWFSLYLNQRFPDFDPGRLEEMKAKAAGLKKRLLTKSGAAH